MPLTSRDEAPLYTRIVETPVVSGLPLAETILEEIIASLDAERLPDPAAAAGRIALDQDATRLFVLGVLEGSPYLASLIRRDPQRFARLLASPPGQALTSAGERLRSELLAVATQAEAMSSLRRYKSEAALLIALADLAGAWPQTVVTQALTEVAEQALAGAVRFLFRHAAQRGDWQTDDPAVAADNSGYIVLGMGKFGAFELNYSSDIDLIVFYDTDRLRVRSGLEPQAFFVRLTRDVVKLMQERTGDGYVFRTDLRLRPDPGATQVALSTTAALGYYESFGQNWERAAMIKARPVAGDIASGRAFMAELAPYIWRKYLDYAAIADIHAMKRQIHAYRGFGEIAVAGHNIKLGRGGIREIEFFVQTQQLIAGGRQPDLRVSSTLAALEQLSRRGWIAGSVCDELGEAYCFLRRLEHRLQMINDEQTHQLPTDDVALEKLARFSGFAGLAQLADTLTVRLKTVQQHYAVLFETTPELTKPGTNMVFAGAVDDPDTMAALKGFGFSQPSQVLATVRGWHHGRYVAVSSPRARERLTEVQPLLIEALARTADPDGALAGFDRFLAHLPAGVQLFSLLRSNPKLLTVVADIMGSAPRLARILSRRARALDALLDPRVMSTLPTAADLDAVVAREIAAARDLQEILDAARIVASEQQFLLGVRVLTGMIGTANAGAGFALLAERMIVALQSAVEADFSRTNGLLPASGMAVVAMGKLGGAEMTAASDLDLLMIYDFDAEQAQSIGLKPLPASVYFARICQRLISAISAPTAEGRIYEVDMRLRPSGQKGPLATQLASFIDYQMSAAWTWEHMALTRARVLSGPTDLKAAVETAIHRVLVQPRDRGKIVADVRDMRQRIAAEKGTGNIWDLKQVRGGLVDIEFIAQFLQLVHANRHPEVLDQSTIGALSKLERAGLLDAGQAAVVLPAAQLVHDLTQILRLTLDGGFDPVTAPDGVKRLLLRVADQPTFEHLTDELTRNLGDVAVIFDEIVR